MQIDLNTAVRLPVRLITAANVAVTGQLPADVTNGAGAGNASLVRGDGTVVNLPLTNNVNWYEIDDTAAPGLYHVLVPLTATSVLGTFQLVVQPASPGAFLTNVITAQVRPSAS